MAVVLLPGVRASGELDWVAEWLSIVDDVTPVAAALDAGNVG